ncbi:hypothetical protein BGZ72_001229 [Mortierella alpina]|nr:hypothetical protein BGZ72_001229 [Mortierella alpina]
MPRATLITLSVFAALIGIAAWLPMQRMATLLEGSRQVENFGMENCKRVSGPSFCEDVRVDPTLRLGFMACDPSLRYRNHAVDEFHQSKVSENGALWIYDLNKPASSAEKLVLQGLSGPFHPTGLSIALTTENSTSARTVLLVVNRVPSEMPRIEVLYYYPARKNLVHKKTISSPHFYAAHKVSASSSPFVHQTDDTPSFIVSNDHGYSISDWKRTYEERFNLPAATLAYHNARANETREIARRLQMPSALVESHEPDLVWMAQAKGGSVGLYRTQMDSAGRQEQQVFSVDTNEPITITWPGWRVSEVVQTGLVNVGIDYDRASQTLVTVAHSSWNAFKDMARELEKTDTAERLSMLEGKGAGMVISRARMYPVRIGQTHPRPLKDIVVDPQETPKRYRMQYFYEPVISHDGSDFGSPSAIAFVPAESSEHGAERVLVTGQYERGILECILA